MEVDIILGQAAYELQSPLDYKTGARSEPFAVLTELGWVVSGKPCFQNQRCQSDKERTSGKNMLESTMKFTGERYEVGMLGVN